MKKAAYGIVGLVVLLVAAALVVPSFIDWNAYKAEIATEVRKATGRTLDIGGELEFAVLPTPRLRVTNARLSNAPGATATHMVSLKEFEVSVKLAPLVQGDIEVAGVELIEPVIELEKLPGGGVNWAFTPEQNQTGAPSKPSTASESKSSAFKLDRLRIVNGTVVYRDGSAGTVERIENLTATGSAESLVGPFTFDGGLQIRNIPLTLSARVSKFAEKGAVPFRADLGTPGTNTAIGLTGTVTDIESKPSISAKLNGKGDNLGTIVRIMAGANTPPQLDQAFSVTAAIKGSETAVSLEQLAIGLGGSTLTGNVNVVLQDGVRADVALQMTSLDIDALTAAKSVSAPNAASSGSQSKVSKSEPEAAPKATAPFEIPADIEANLGLSIEQVVANKGRIRGVRLAVSMKDGAVTLNTLEARLPGGGQLSADGVLQASKGLPAFRGKTSFRATNLRNLLEWMEVDISAVPADRLRRLNLSADISGNSSQIQIANIVSQLDASRMSGGVTVALRDRIAFGASFNVDQLNADAYLGSSRSNASGGGAKAPGGVPVQPKQDQKTPDSPLAVLNDFDANIAIRVGSLSYKQTAIQGARFDGTLVNGELNLKDASVRSLAGTSARVQGVVTNFDATPAFKGTVAAASDNLTGLFRVAGIKSDIPPRKFGKMRLSSRVDFSGADLKLNADLQVAEVRANIAGNATGLPDNSRFDFTLDAKHPELARLAALLSGEKPGPRAGRVHMKLGLKGSEKAVSLNSSSVVAGGVFRISGTVGTPLDIPKLDLAFDLKHPDLYRLVRTFDPGFRPANQKLGALQLAANLSGTESNLSIGGLNGTIGPTKISGSGSYADGPVRPLVKLALQSSVIPLNDFLEAPPARRAQAVRSGSAGNNASVQPSAGPRWSTDPIDTDAFGLVDAIIDLQASALLYQTFRVDQPKIAAVLKDKVLDIQRISGTMFDGGFEMRGQVDGRSVPTATTTLKIEKANVGKALFQAAEFDIATGVLSFDMSLAARGRSQNEMIKALNGKGGINVVNGAVKGFDLKKVSDNLKNLNQLTGLLGVLSSAMGGGVTRFSSLTGTFGIERGILRTNDLQLSADAGAGQARGFADLPRWNMDMLADFRLTEHPSAPPFRVRAVGPPDDPRRLFDFQALQAWVLEQGVGGLIKNLIPGARGNSGQQQEQQQQKQQVKPEDILRGLLKGLGR